MYRKTPFTLVEILVAIGIVLLLAALTIGGLRHAAAKGDQAKTVAIIQKFEMALEAYKADYGIYPIFNDEVDLSKDAWKKFCNRTVNKQNRPYMEGEQGKLLDAYGNPLRYKYPPTTDAEKSVTSKCLIWSNGKDGEAASDVTGDGEKNLDNICNWKQN